MVSNDFRDFYKALDSAISLCDVRDSKYDLELLRKRIKIIERKYGGIYGQKLCDVSRFEAEGKVVTSVAIHRDNQKFIDQLQAEAKEHYFSFSKEMIINMALICLRNKYSDMNNIEELVDCFY